MFRRSHPCFKNVCYKDVCQLKAKSMSTNTPLKINLPLEISLINVNKPRNHFGSVHIY